MAIYEHVPLLQDSRLSVGSMHRDTFMGTIQNAEISRERYALVGIKGKQLTYRAPDNQAVQG
jgi:hypothetical protein